MTKLVVFLAAAASVAAPALADTPISFQRDGIHYVGSLSEHGGVQHIVGHEVASGRVFDLVVSKGQVRGTYNDSEVSYKAPVGTLVASR